MTSKVHTYKSLSDRIEIAADTGNREHLHFLLDEVHQDFIHETITHSEFIDLHLRIEEELA